MDKTQQLHAFLFKSGNDTQIDEEDYALDKLQNRGTNVADHELQGISKKPLSSLQSIGYFAHTVWLFTRSDHKTFVFPETMFGIFGALSGPLLTTNPSPVLAQVLCQVPKVLLWTWLNTFVFVLANQRLPEAVEEDRLNKPFRPLASDRITSTQTRRLLLMSIPLVLALTYCHLGSYEETVLLFCLTWMYNDLGGSQEDFMTRNLIISVAYTIYGSGALRVVTASNAAGHTLNTNGYIWSGIVGAIIFTTMQIQDLKDQEGDRSRNRQTAPLVLGDTAARWTVAIPLVMWSIFCPIFWKLTSYFAVVPLALSCVIAIRVLRMRSTDADRTTWKLWSYWLVLVYAFPVMKAYC